MSNDNKNLNKYNKEMLNKIGLILFYSMLVYTIIKTMLLIMEKLF